MIGSALCECTGRRFPPGGNRTYYPKSRKCQADGTSGQRASNYGNHHHDVASYEDVSQVVAALVQADVFTFVKGRGTGSERGGTVEGATDLFAEGVGRIASGAPLRQYKKKSRANWGTQTWEADNDPEWDDVDALEGSAPGPGVLDEN